ncbi:tyrosine-protein phosphatase [Dysgonomonas sp. Marseille-P4677]|uniref:tyrosine-protein phosphatase n=1 Tax=Dysgonomonas sp. Marseille-P4677 TaxID=2364790 RepID=UPI00191348FB|nr:tyrosine-protein phosphatase [Dysgonomonas sp. Marseille-P4677]MBK5720917.1 tyrosine-protein phosphatase [Dysgonomonas sp. Marseille-P4677]
MKKLIIAMTLVTLLSTSCNKKESQKAEYSGEDISKDITIIREKTTKNASIQIYTNGQWTLYAGPSVDNIDFSQPIAKGINSGTFPLNVTDSARSYFAVVTEKGTAIVADRHLPMTGGYNFRDMGGYQNTDGKYVKWGKVFRSDDLHNLTDADLEYLAAIPLVSIVDFRSEEEMQMGPDKNPTSLKKNYAYSISPGNLMNAVKKDVSKITSEQADQLMMDMNVLLVSDTTCINRYKDFFALLQNEDDAPLMFHCSAGKDRTGMAAALFLSALGVDEKTIIKDYLLSNTYLANKYAKLKAENPAMKSFFEVKAEFLQAGLDRIKKDHGSVENYLKNVLNVDIQKMRDLYLY